MQKKKKKKAPIRAAVHLSASGRIFGKDDVMASHINWEGGGSVGGDVAGEFLWEEGELGTNGKKSCTWGPQLYSVAQLTQPYTLVIYRDRDITMHGAVITFTAYTY